MNKILLVAQREIVNTVANKGFLFGLLIMPLILGLVLIAGPRLRTALRSPQVVGSIAVIDSTARVVPALRSTLAPTAIEARRIENARRALATVPGAEQVASDETLRQGIGSVPKLTIDERAPGADVEEEKKRLSSSTPADRPLALIVIHPNAVQRADGDMEYGTYDLYAARGLDDATEGSVFESLREALVSARLGAAELDPKRIESMTRVTRPRSVIVTAGGEQRAQRQFMRMLPFIVGVLLFVGVITGGSALMTSTVEEKSSRVVEVLLAAISPFQLMAGKLLGQLVVGLLTMSIYLGLGLLALYSFAMIGIIDPMLIVYMLVFFLITYLVFGALMMAIGAAVNQMQEAQSLMGPVMLLLMMPYLLSPFIGRAPNSPLSIAFSFIPPINTFAMMTRMASDSPPPAWQVWLSVLVGLGGAVAAIWFAAKIFKVGLLMHGKPPNIRTMIRWAREA